MTRPPTPEQLCRLFNSSLWGFIKEQLLVDQQEALRRSSQLDPGDERTQLTRLQGRSEYIDLITHHQFEQRLMKAAASALSKERKNGPRRI